MNHFDRMVDDYVNKRLSESLTMARTEAYRAGLQAAASKVLQWAEMGAGGAGAVDDRSKNLAEAIRCIDPSKGY